MAAACDEGGLRRITAHEALLSGKILQLGNHPLLLLFADACIDIRPAYLEELDSVVRLTVKATCRPCREKML